MDEKYWAERFEYELGILMEQEQGSRVLRQESPGSLQLVLQAARSCLTANFALESQVREKLLSKLLSKFNREDIRFLNQNDDLSEGTDAELDDLNLDEVVGGLSEPSTQGCSECGCRLQVSNIHGERCPECGHPRSLHY